MKHVWHDGGRADAGFKGEARDCVVRAIAIALRTLPGYRVCPPGEVYLQVYNDLHKWPRGRVTAKHKSPRTGVMTKTKWFREFMAHYGFEWTPTMQVGKGCTTHMRASELPAGAIIVAVSRHYACVIDGVLWDSHDSSNGGTRCVYGYWSRA